MSFWAYMLHCRGGAYYTGHTDNLENRLGQHESGAVPGFAADRLPVKLVWSQEFPTRYEALAAERQMKGWSRAKKMALVRGDWGAVSHLAQCRGTRAQSSPERAVPGSGQAEDRKAIDRSNPVRPEPVEGPSFPLLPSEDREAILSCVLAAGTRELDLRFTLCTDRSALRIPPPAPPVRTDGLWQTTCFELFLRGAGDAYVEWNLAPSGAWAAYAFDGYRQAMRDLDTRPPSIEWSNAECALVAALPLAGIVAHIGPPPWRANITAVIEAADGSISHHALAHPDGLPDFHDPACFVATIG